MKHIISLLVAFTIAGLSFASELPTPGSKASREFGVYKNHPATLLFERPSPHVLVVRVNLDLPSQKTGSGLLASASLAEEFAELSMTKILAVIDQDCESSKTKPLSIQRISPYTYLITLE